MTNERYELPDGWAWTTLKSVVILNMGQSPKGVFTNNTGEGLPLIGGASDIEDGEARPTRYTSHPGKVCRPGDIIVCVRATIGKLTKADGEYCLGRGVAAIEPDLVDGDFLRLYLVACTKQLSDLGTGSTFKQISKDDLYAFPIPFAPPPEQRRIVAKIEALFEQSRTARQALDRIPPLLKKFRQSILAAAFRGDLTCDWREQHPDVEPASALLERIRTERLRRYQEELRKAKAEGRRPQKKTADLHPRDLDTSRLPELPGDWAWATVEVLASPGPRSIQSGPFGSNLLHSEFQDSGILAIGIDNVHDGRFAVGSQHRISHQKYEELKKYTARPLDVLITVMATVGRCCVVPKDIKTAIITKHVYRISVDHALCEPSYLMNALRGCPAVQEQLYGEIQGVTRPGINGEILKRLLIPVPPIEEQRVIVSRIQSLFGQTDAIEVSMEAARRRADEIDQSILARAFRGELVPQNPNDEPASLLLERIRGEREKANPAKGQAVDGRREKT